MTIRSLLCALPLAAGVALAGCAGPSAARRLDLSTREAPDRDSALTSLVAAERAFVTLARDSGTYAAFLANMADSSLLFRPGPVNGHRWMVEHPSDDRTSLLAWEPRYADVSRSGDFGWTTGPYELRPRGSGDTTVYRGSFLTVWRRAPGGAWKVFFDGGGGDGPWTLTPAGWGDWTAASPASAAFPAVPAATASLLAVDSAIGAPHREGRAWDALLGRLEEGGRVYRQGRASLVGREAARASLGTWEGTYHSAPLGSMMAASGDLALTYGRYELQGATAASPSDGHYVRLWRRAPDGAWRVAFDVAFPMPHKPAS